MLLSLLVASIPVAPFTSPNNIYIKGFPLATVPDQNFKKSNWLLTEPSSKPTKFKNDIYVGLTRRRGNIVTLHVMERRLTKPTPETDVDYVLSRTWMGKGYFIPDYGFTLRRFDCANDTSSYERVVMTTDAIGDGPESKGGFKHPTDSSETNWVVTANQKRVTIEGYPHWAYRLPSNDPRNKNISFIGDWKPVRPGSIGASHLDYACDNY